MTYFNFIENVISLWGKKSSYGIPFILRKEPCGEMIVSFALPPLPIPPLKNEKKFLIEAGNTPSALRSLGSAAPKGSKSSSISLLPAQP